MHRGVPGAAGGVEHPQPRPQRLRGPGELRAGQAARQHDIGEQQVERLGAVQRRLRRGVGQLARIGVAGGLLGQQRRRAGDDRQQVVEVMREPAGELAHRLHLPGLRKPAAELLDIGALALHGLGRAAWRRRRARQAPPIAPGRRRATVLGFVQPSAEGSMHGAGGPPVTITAP
jgi:hypothetical protein